VSDICRICKRPIASHERRIYAVVGYEESREGGGQNHVVRKQRLDGMVWHKPCWETAVRRKEGRGEQLEFAP
jgi:hypothetical protein